MKIKVKPEDFIVEEIADIPIKKKGDFGLYLLEKKGWNTVDLLSRFSREFGIPLAALAYGGKKDRHALTRQHISIRGQGEGIEVSVENYSLRFIGCCDRPMGPDLIKGNRFEITIRDLTEQYLQSALCAMDAVKKNGYANYFDDQRFGSYDPRQGFIAEKILRGHYNGALKIYLAHIHPEDKRDEKERKRFFFEYWGDWQACSEKAKTEFERRAFGYLTKEPKAFIPLLQKIPREEMSLFFSAYQSYLWNEILRRIVRLTAKDLTICPGIVGDYLFYERMDEGDPRYLKALHIPTPASNVGMPDALTEKIYAEVLRDNRIKSSSFNIRRVRQAFFKSTERKAIVFPESLSADFSEDEMYEDRKKLVLRFILPRGSYGTMLVKRLFSAPSSIEFHQSFRRDPQ